MRWVYLDPQGTMQGPFSGLEMNDWFKANFFSGDLRVKRLEDNDFEPLAQVIRRIGNSREPFLVPQMGIPHGPPPSGGPFGGPTAEAVPPLQSAFPSFGRTLTAQQQNELERRKQEDQMFHARQREMHHHPGFGRLPPIQPGGLHHHSSAHSLQSQPSFGSMTSPIGVTPQHSLGPIAPAGGFFDSAVSMAPGPAQAPIGSTSDLYNQDLNFNERQMLAHMQSSGNLPGAFPGVQAPGGPVGEGSGLRSQLPTVDQLQKDAEGFSERLEEFHELRAQFDAEQADAATTSESKENGAEQGEKDAVQAAVESTQEAAVTGSGSAEAKTAAAQAELTLTEKVRKTQADNAKSSEPAPPSDLPMPFPPPAQATPLPAPTAQRVASNLPARYGDRSGSGSPDTASEGAALAPPPTAPWAPQPGAEAQKGPSLREIQEAEAKKAAKKEEAAAAARRAALEQEAAAQREREKAAAAAASSGLPAASTWGTGSPVGAPSGGSPWKQPAALKTAVVAAASGNTPSKKTLAEIQREEELRKQKAAKEAAAAAAAIQVSTTPVPSIGKRYADLASKTSGSPGPTASAVAAQPGQSGGWATVGAGGKVKVPTGPAVQSRSPSVGNIKTTPSPIMSKPAAKAGQTTAKDVKSAAMDEFKKWLHRELGRGLDGVTDSKLLLMPRSQIRAAY
jgi:PERQ amino acid-rich with GYF domain-containing protein